MRHRGGGGGTDKRNSDRATIIRGLPMDGATHHLGAQLLMWVREDGMRLANRWTELFTKRRSDRLHHQPGCLNLLGEAMATDRERGREVRDQEEESRFGIQI